MTVLAFLRRNAVVLLGALLIVGGLYLWSITRFPPTFGWYLYAPLERTPRRYADYLPAGSVVPWPQLGLLLAAAGLALLAGGVGYRIGRRTALRHPPDR